MHILFTVYFFLVGLCFGSFALATAWRIKKHKGFVKERSECEKCHHVLAAKDLVPLISWISQKGRCRYCRKKLSKMLPLAELAGALFFATSYALWPDSFGGILGTARFAMWVVALILLLILFFYDLQWFILPNKIIYPLWAISGLDVVLRFAQAPKMSTVISCISSVAVASGIFWLLFQLSKGKWIGFGDVRLGLAIGLLVGGPLLAAMVIFVASLIGTFAAIPGLIAKKASMTSKLPFGPMLIVGLIIVRLLGQKTIDWYMLHLVYF